MKRFLENLGFGKKDENEFEPSNNDPEELYGPPEMFGNEPEDEPEDELGSVSNPLKKLNDKFNPARNAPEVVYGPPPGRRR